MFKRKDKTARATKIQQPVAAPTRKITDERDVLRSRHALMQTAEQAIAELEGQVARLEKIIADAATADQALQTAITSDGGQALAAFSAGELAPDLDIGTLLANAENTSRAAVAAKAALPNAKAQLDAARAQLPALEEQRRAAELDFLKLLANEKGLQYKQLFAALCRVHDELVGVSNALIPLTPDAPEIRMTAAPVTVPSFNLASVRHPNEWIAQFEHRANEYIVQDVAQKWLAARQRLANDVEADVSDLLDEAA